MMKRRRALALALLLLLTVLTACGEPYGGTADTSAGPSAGAGEETAAPDGGAEPLSPEDVRDLFADAAQENGYTVLGCTAVDDGACSLAGVVLHTTAENDVTRLAFLEITRPAALESLRQVTGPWSISGMPGWNSRSGIRTPKFLNVMSCLMRCGRRNPVWGSRWSRYSRCRPAVDIAKAP